MHVCTGLYIIYLILQFKMLFILHVTALISFYFQFFTGLVVLEIHLNVLHPAKMQQCPLHFAMTVLYCHTSCPAFTYQWCVRRRGFRLSRATTVQKTRELSHSAVCKSKIQEFLTGQTFFFFPLKNNKHKFTTCPIIWYKNFTVSAKTLATFGWQVQYPTQTVYSVG